ncbi:MAG: macro domain-containing protein [Pseudomonadota bacterium]
MKIIKGDLIQLAITGQFDVIIHGCNCFCSMGAGIAKQIKEHFPQAYQADLDTTPGDRQKLGNFSCVQVKKGGNFFTIVNGYTQYNHSGSGPLVDYDAVEQLFIKIKKEYTGLKIGFPKIGAGLAKGDWNIISKIIDATLKGEDRSLVVYAPVPITVEQPDKQIKNLELKSR